jgi:hypothetical protein
MYLCGSNTTEGQELEAQVFDRSSGQKKEKMVQKSPQNRQAVSEQGEAKGMQRSRDRMEMPEGFEDMTQEERKAYMEENSSQAKERGVPQGMELPEGWEDMTEEEKHTYMEENRPEGSEDFDTNERKGGMLESLLEEANIDLPDEWDDMTREERQSFLEKIILKFQHQRKMLSRVMMNRMLLWEQILLVKSKREIL